MRFDNISFLDLLEEIVDNRGKTCPTADAGIPLIATNCVLNDHLYPVFEKIRYVDDENRDYYKIYADYYKSQNYIPKYVQLIMFVYDNEFVIFINDPNKISQKGAYTKFYENPLLTNLTFATVKKETTSKHLKGVRTIFNTPPTTK